MWIHLKTSSHQKMFIALGFVFASAGTTILEAKRKPDLSPAVVLPESFAGQSQVSIPVDAEWWKQFQDADLADLVRLGFQNNRDVALGRARLIESRAGVRLSEQALFPKFSSSFGFTDATRSNNSPAIPRIGQANPPAGFPSGLGELIPRRYGVFDSGFDASYEVDLFGFHRSAAQASRLDGEAQIESLRDTFVSLAAEIVRCYMNLREAQMRLRLAGQTEESFRESLKLITYRTEAGLAGESDRLQIEAQLTSARAAIAPIAATVEQSVYALAALTGQSRDQLAYLATAGDRGLPEPGPIRAGLPSEVLLNRPDVRRAAAQLKASAARRRSAEKDWFPRFSLTSAVGGQSGELANILSTGSLVSTLAPKLTWGALQFRQTKAAIDRQKALEQQQLAILETTILSALRDVDTALSSVTREKQRILELEHALSIDQQKSTVAQQRFAAGLTNYLGVLDAQRQEIASADRLTQSRAVLIRSLISLHKALGGGWPQSPRGARNATRPNEDTK